MAYRIEGGPAIADFQGFLADLDTAVGAVIAQPAAFQQFQAAVLPQPAAQADQDALMTEVQAWYLRYHTLISRALPPNPWGPSRLDAVAMIFDRLTGLDLGPPPSHLIPENVRVADAPVRYPFLWNAPIQDHTQWPAFAQNGNDVLALSRNLGEEFGVFGEFFPAKDASNLILHVDYRTQNSANFAGLESLEGLIKQIGPPAYPWRIDPALAARGKAIYDAPTAQGGCAECHGIRPGEDRLTFSTTWATPAMDVGTEAREHDLLARTAQSGVLAGARIPFITSPLAATDTAFDLLATSVTGSILEPQLRDLTDSSHTLAMASGKASAATLAAVAAKPDVVQLGGAFTAPSTTVYKYESRVLQGIWATAPYLHNGSVPTLADLLKPAAQRPASFAVGPAYDKDALGLARTQTKFGYVLRTTDCSDRNSGNSRCGHEFGTTLPDADKTDYQYSATVPGVATTKGGRGDGPLERGTTTTVRRARFRPSAVRTTAGLVLRISLPRVGSRSTHQTSPRRGSGVASAGDRLNDWRARAARSVRRPPSRPTPPSRRQACRRPRPPVPPGLADHWRHRHGAGRARWLCARTRSSDGQGRDGAAAAPTPREGEPAIARSRRHLPSSSISISSGASSRNGRMLRLRTRRPAGLCDVDLPRYRCVDGEIKSSSAGPPPWSSRRSRRSGKRRRCPAAGPANPDGSCRPERAGTRRTGAAAGNSGPGRRRR